MSWALLTSRKLTRCFSLSSASESDVAASSSTGVKQEQSVKTEEAEPDLVISSGIELTSYEAAPGDVGEVIDEVVDSSDATHGSKVVLICVILSEMLGRFFLCYTHSFGVA